MLQLVLQLKSYFRSRHGTELGVTTRRFEVATTRELENQRQVVTSLRGRDRKYEAEPSEVPVRENEVATTLLFKDLEGGRDQSLRSRPEDTISIRNPGHNYV